MANIWDEFDKAIDTEGLAKDVEEAAENGGRKEVPHDTYEVAVTKLELTKSKKGDPMVTAWMKIVEGEYKGSLIFMNQVVTQGFQIHIAIIFNLLTFSSACAIIKTKQRSGAEVHSAPCFCGLAVQWLCHWAAFSFWFSASSALISSLSSLIKSCCFFVVSV